MEPEQLPLPRAEWVIFVAVETPSFRKLLLHELRSKGYSPREINQDEIFKLETIFDRERLVIFFVESSPDKVLLYQIARHLYTDWSEKGFVAFCILWPEALSDIDVYRFRQWDAGWHYDPPNGFFPIHVIKTAGPKQVAQACLRCLSYRERSSEDGNSKV